MSNLSPSRTLQDEQTKSIPLLADDNSQNIQLIPQERPQIEAEDVSFFVMVKWLLWKNVKSQCQRRKRAWCTKMCIPVAFTLILALLRTAFSVDNQPIDYGQYINNPTAINMTTTNNLFWAPRILCDNSTEEPAFMISIVPPYGTNPHIDKVIDKLNKSWTVTSDTPTLKGRCIDYITTLPFKETWMIKYFESDSAVDAYCKSYDYGRGYHANGNVTDSANHRPIGFGITFDIPNGDGLDWSYRLRFNGSGGANGVPAGQGPPSFFTSQFPVPATDQAPINKLNRALMDQWLQGSSNYAYSAFINVQSFVDNAISEVVADLTGSNVWNSTAGTTVSTMTKGYFAFPTASYQIDAFWTTLQPLFVFFVVVSFVYPFSQIVKALVEEKASKIKEGLKMMGATFGTFWVSWYIFFFCEFIIMAICFTLIGKWFNVFLYSDVSVIFVWMTLFCVNLVTYATLVSTIFDNPKVGSLIGVFMFILALYGGFFGAILNKGQKGWLCLLGPSCYSMSLGNLAQYEASLIGLQWENIDDEFADFKFSTSIYMLLFDSILYVALTLYMDKVFPSRYGQRQSPFFICKPICMSCFRCPRDNKARLRQDVERIDRQKKYTLETSDCFESVSSKFDHDEPAISVRKLTKHFKSSMFSKKIVKAVNGISMDMFNGEVFCLLGHNGAGKTTTINMLTGLLDITSGNARIMGNSVEDEDGMKNIRKSMGVCPQHDVLFDRLTVQEHLQLFCKLKGIPSEFIASEVEYTVKLIGMQEKKDEFSTNLSGGQKRKLSLGIALIGGSKIVFLDEPTSGMDPQSRRVTWDLIAREKRDRCIILTTHYMDEADILADRIAIMSTGYIRCCGSALFLKRLYGVGYTFTISLKIGIDDQQRSEASDQIGDMVLQQIKGSAVVSSAGGEIAYRLPFEQTAAFPDIFDKLDTMTKKNVLPISTYGISITTLEEVFLRIGEEHKDEIIGDDDGRRTSSISVDPFDDDTESMKLQNISTKYTEYESLQSSKPNGTTSLVSQAHSIQETGRHKKSLLEQQEEEMQRNLDRQKEDYEDYHQIFPQPTFALQEQSEIVIFLEHFVAILYRRWYWGIRDFRALCCQILLPGYFAAIGLVLLKLSASVNDPDLVLSTDQFYGSEAGLNGYAVPFTNITQYAPNKPFAVESSWTNTYDKYFGDACGELEYANLGPSALYDVTPFQDWLLDNFESDNKYHYNAYATVNGYSNLTANGSVELFQLNNTIQLGVNLTAVHVLPIAYNLANNWILKELINENASIAVSSFPLVITNTEKAISDSVSGVFASIFLMIAFAFIPVGAIYNIVMDRIKLTKHQQFVSGISFVSYWLGNYVADFIAAIPAMLIVYVMVHAFNVDVYCSVEAQGPFILVLILFTLAILPFTYILSYWFKAADKAQTVVGTIYLIVGMILLIVSFVLDGINEKTKNINDSLENIYRIFPTFLMADSLFRIAIKGASYPNASYYQWDITGRNLTFMALQCVGYFIVVLLIEYIIASPDILNKFGLIFNVNDEIDDELDDDVNAEKERILKELDDGSSTDTVILSGLRKVYKASNKDKPPNIAVRDVYLGVPQGQVFGYLGVNGAGKTSTLACLTGQRFKSSGQAFIHGISIDDQIKCRRFVGYCPQFDALFDLLTAKEHLKFYGRLKGLRGQELKDQTNLLLKVLSLTKYRNRRAGTYSGGNKRKLSVAIAMIGNPPVVFLDEPSTGMDPMARRFMWEFIRNTMDGRCVVLTTHSMEECEALCHRLGIMVKGQLRCLGTPQHLKSKFGKGYQLDLTLIDETQKIYEAVQSDLMSAFNLRLIERNQAKITYEIDQNEEGPLSLAQMFRTLEELKNRLPIVSYALNQTTLEQIFIKMAKQHDGVSEF